MSLYLPLDCAFARDPRMRAAGPIARLVYIEAALFCRENLTDGVIDRLNLPDFAADVPAKSRHLARLVEVGALDVIDVGWRIPERVWRKWNPLRSEVDGKRKAEAERKAAYRAAKLSQRDTNGTGEAVPTGHRVAQWDTRKQPEPEPEPEPEPKPKPEPKPEPEPEVIKQQHNPKSVQAQRIAAAASGAIALLVEHKLATERPRNPSGYRHTMPDKLAGDWRERIGEHQRHHPDATAADIARAVLGLTTLDLRRISA